VTEIFWYKVTNVSEEPAASNFRVEMKIPNSLKTLVNFYHASQGYVSKTPSEPQTSHNIIYPLHRFIEGHA
jgi:hypothetical protein